MLVFFSRIAPNRQEGNRASTVRPVRGKSESALVPSPAPSNAVQNVSTTFVLPTGIDYIISSVNQGETLLPILGAVSNAVLSVDRILKSKSYNNIEEFGRTVWLESKDRAQLTVWIISPYRTNAAVGAIKAIVYRDADMTQEDPARSFQVDFYPETGVLRDFWWADNHEVLLFKTNSMSSDYARHLDGKKRLIMRWDVQGNLISSNVYDWTTRGRVIGGVPRTNTPIYRLGPTSAVEAATGSWRRKPE